MFEVDASWELVLCIGETVVDEAMLMAWRLQMIGELLNRRIAEVEAEDDDPGYMLVTGFARTVAEVRAAMHLSTAAASKVVSQAESLTNRLPQVAAVLQRGKIDWESVAVIIAHTELVTDEAILARLDAALAQRITGWCSWSRKRVTNAVDAGARNGPRRDCRTRTGRSASACAGASGRGRDRAGGRRVDRAGRCGV